MSNENRKLGLFMLIALVTGNMVGSGLFMLPVEIARIGSIGILSWIFTSFGAFALALVFAKMSLLIPKTGGQYAYAKVGFGEFIGFQTAYNYWIALWVGNASIGVAMVGYLSVFFPIVTENNMVGTFVEIAMLWILTIVNIRGVHYAGIMQTVTTVLKFLPILLVAAFGWYYFHPEYILNNFNISGKPTFEAFSYAATITLWSFVGVESAAIPAGSVKNPARNIPLATLLGTAIAAVIYISSAIAITGMIPMQTLANSTSPFAMAASIIVGPWGALLIAGGAVISCFGALNGWILLQGQVPMAAAQDKLFPKIFAKCNKHDVPAAGLIISSALTTVLLILISSFKLIEQFQLLILIASVTSLSSYFYTAVSEMIILPKQSNIVPWKKCFHLIIAFLAAIYSFWTMFGAGRDIIFYVAMLIFTSFPMYGLLKYKKGEIAENNF